MLTAHRALAEKRDDTLVDAKSCESERSEWRRKRAHDTSGFVERDAHRRQEDAQVA